MRGKGRSGGRGTILRRALLPLLLSLPVPAYAAPPDPVVARWQGTDGPDTASMLELTADGHFRYALSEGALDEGAKGRWHREGATVRLYTEPVPTPPRFIVKSMENADKGPLTLFVGGPDGRGVAGVEFRVEFDSGDPVEAYTQYDGWTGDPADRRPPRWVQLHEPVYDITSDRMPIPGGARTLRFTLEPHDLGIVNFRGTEVVVDGNSLTLRDGRGERHYSRATP
ncbi:MAG TPA: hypothetical protein VF503_33345 [Sphingobium sp.]|uniref:hypothetical protein n=1 Tax=Sphingobium sp. TaxID=1912891 RepID=UPI002ED1D142